MYDPTQQAALEKSRAKKHVFHELKLLLAVFISLVLFFSMQNFVENIGGHVKTTLTGDAIRIGEEGNTTKINISVPPKQPPIPSLPPVLQCWQNGGLQPQDITVFGHLLRDIPCAQGLKKPVTASFHEGCIDATIKDEVTTRLCQAYGLPTFTIDFDGFVRQGSGSVIALQPREKNYSWYILFFICLIIIVLFWREYEMNLAVERRHKIEQKEYEEREKQRKAAQGKDNRVVYVTAAPPYDVKKLQKEEKEEKRIATAIKKDQKKKEKGREKSRLALIKQFNDLAEKINDYIIDGKLDKARRDYLKLFAIYSEVVLLVDKNNRVTLDEVMQYLCNYLGVLHDIKKSKRTGVSQKKKVLEKEDVKVVRQKPTLMSMQTLNEMKEMIEQKQYDRAKRLFDQDKVGSLDAQDAARNVVKKPKHLKDDLEGIEIRHDKIFKQGIVRVDKNEYYKFMAGLSFLRKQLQQKRRKKS